jgi:HEAT repeat protein
VRSALITAVERTDRRDLSDALIRIASADSEPGLRAQALAALRSLGIRDALPTALAALADDDQNVRMTAVEFVGEFGSPEILGQLHAQTSDVEPRIRAASVLALGRLGGQVGDADVSRLMRDPDWTVREAAIITATNASLRSLLPTMIELLSDTDPRVRRRAAAAVGVMGEADTVPRLLAAFPDPSAEVSEAIAVAVSRLDPDAVVGLADALVDSPDVNSKLALIRTLGRSQADPHDVLHRLRGDSSPAVRAAALDSLCRRARRSVEPSDTVMPALESGLRDPDELVRAAAADAWGRLAEEAQMSRLLTLLEQDPSPRVRERAALSLGLRHVSGADSALIAVSRRAEPPNVRAAAALAAGVFDRESIVARVLEMPDQGHVREVLRERLKWDAHFRLLGLKLSKARHLELRALVRPTDTDAEAALARGARGMLDAGDRVRLIGSLRAFQGEQSRDALLQMARSDPTPEVRTAALAAAGDVLAEDELLATAARALGDPSALVRRAAVELFARARPQPALQRLLQALQQDDDPAVLAAAAALAEEHFTEFGMAARTLSTDSDQAILVIRIARYIVHPDLANLLPQFAASVSPGVREAVADLWKHRPEMVDPVSLQALTQDPDTTIRRQVAGTALAANRYDLLTQMTRDPDPTVRREVALALGRAQPLAQPGFQTLEILGRDAEMSVRAAAYVARLLQGSPVALPPELDAAVAARAVRESADLSRLRRIAQTSSADEQRLSAGLALALVQDDVAREMARTDPAPDVRHRVAGALELSVADPQSP